MRRALMPVVAAAFIASILAGPVAAKGGPNSPSLTLTVCYNQVWSALQVGLSWANQTPNANGVEITINLNGKKIADGAVVLDYAPGLPGTYTVTPVILSPVNGVTDWSSWTSLSAAASVAWVDTSSTVRQPHTGWVVCP